MPQAKLGLTSAILMTLSRAVCFLSDEQRRAHVTLDLMLCITSQRLREWLFHFQTHPLDKVVFCTDF